MTDYRDAHNDYLRTNRQRDYMDASERGSSSLFWLIGIAAAVIVGGLFLLSLGPGDTTAPVDGSTAPMTAPADPAAAPSAAPSAPAGDAVAPLDAAPAAPATEEPAPATPPAAQ